MKNTLWILVLAGLLAACGSDQAEPAAEADSVDSQEVLEEVTVTEEPPAETEDTVMQVVEESAAEPEATEEQPILLAEAQNTAAPRDWQFEEGRHYIRLVPSQPTIGGADKIEVAEFFWYGCPHCYDFEPYINRWEEQKDAGVRLVRIPAMWNPMLDLHARLFYTEEVLVRNGAIQDGPAFRDMVFQEYHRRGNRLTSEAAIQRIFERVGVSEEDFQKTWKSFEVDQKMRVARDMARRYSVSSVPAVVVNGKFRTAANEAGGSYTKLIEVIDELVVRESLK